MLPRMPLSPEAILDELDQAARAFIFPVLDNGYIYPVAARLHAYSDGDSWALLIETVGYSPRAGGLHDYLAHFGPGVVPTEGLGNPLPLLVMDVLDIEDEQQPEHLRPMTASLTIADQGYPLRPSPEPVPLVDVLRGLIAVHPEVGFAPPAELAEMVQPGLPPLLTLDDWRHPDIVHGEMPSSVPTFQQLAQVLASGDASQFAPDDEPNTHWSNWPDGGRL
jgi:hypothetical protein